jgi:hypothetical protein
VEVAMIDETFIEVELVPGVPNVLLAVWCIAGAGVAWFLILNLRGWCNRQHSG